MELRFFGFSMAMHCWTNVLKLICFLFGTLLELTILEGLVSRPLSLPGPRFPWLGTELQVEPGVDVLALKYEPKLGFELE